MSAGDTMTQSPHSFVPDTTPNAAALSAKAAVPRGRNGGRRGQRLLCSPRQGQILTLAAAGLSDPEIASRLRVSYRTVRTQLERLFARYDLHTRTAAVSAWLRNGSETRELVLSQARSPRHDG